MTDHISDAELVEANDYAQRQVIVWQERLAADRQAGIKTGSEAILCYHIVIARVLGGEISRRNVDPVLLRAER